MDFIYYFFPKKVILNNFLIDDYNKIDVDFDRYDRLSKLYKPDKPITLKEHQKEGVKFLLSRKKCILADDMGLGKTKTLCISALEGNFDTVLIICPASLKTNWFDELSFYVPQREITIIGGFLDMKKNELERYLGYGEGKSGKKIQELQLEAKERGKWNENRFVIVNYDILDEFYKIPVSRKKVDIQYAEENSPMLNFIKDKKSLIIIDEAHRLSNMKSQQYKIISGLIKKGKPDSVYLATGTPITNNPQNFYNVLALIENDVTADWRQYMKRYCNAIEIPKNNEEKEKRDRISKEYIREHHKSNWYELTDDEKKELNEIISKNCKMNLIPKDATNLDELMERTKHIYLRRIKEDAVKLPGKYVHEKIYELTPEQKEEYDKLWEEYVEEKRKCNELLLEKNNEYAKEEDNISFNKINQINTELNKELLEGGLYRRYLSNQMIPHTIELTEKCLKRGEKVIIVCCYDEELYTLRDYFGDKCVIYNGKMSLKEKDAAKNKFITDNNCKIFIGNIIAAGVGLTLITSRIVIFNSFDYSYANNSQMEDRCYRIGQTRDVHIFYQLFKNTDCERVWNIVLKKEYIIKKVIKKESEK